LLQINSAPGAAMFDCGLLQVPLARLPSYLPGGRPMTVHAIDSQRGSRPAAPVALLSSPSAPPPGWMLRGEPAPAPAPPVNAYRASLREAIRSACRPYALSDWSVAELAALGRGHRYRARSQVVSAGSMPASSLWLLVRGRVSLGKRDARERWWQSRELEAGDWIDVSSAWMGDSHPETALALTPVMAHEFPVDEVVGHCLNDAALVRVLLACVAAQARGATLQKQALLTKDTHARLAAWLLERCEVQDEHSPCAQLLLRQHKKDIASQLGITPETLSRSLRQLQEQGLLHMDGYHMHFPDLQRLRQLAERRPPRYMR
jgi:CRP-like cAMP-binding protein